MFEFPKDLSQARILICNDDGIHAQGIKVLEQVALSLTPHVWVVAPETQQSAAGHSLSIHTPLRLHQYDERHVSVTGTPTDSVLIGVKKVLAGVKPDLVLSGINHGQNTADDVTYSGTVAAAIEAVLMRIPAVAISQDFDESNPDSLDFSLAGQVLPALLSQLSGMRYAKSIVLNVNLPCPRPGVTPDIRVVPQGHYEMEAQEPVHCVDPRGRPYYWVGAPPARAAQDGNSDIGQLPNGHVTVTPLSLNLTHYETLKALEAHLSGKVRAA